MTTGKEKLLLDLAELESMANKMETYLESKDLFWPATDPDGVQPTIGGYLMRQHRLMALSDPLLDSTQQAQLHQAVETFQEALKGKQYLLEQKAIRELKTRVRLWDQALQELLETDSASMAYYGTEVKNRVMATALVTKLQAIKAQVDPVVTKKIDLLDNKLRQSWCSGPFIWPSEWKMAYPQATYWWLYGELEGSF